MTEQFRAIIRQIDQIQIPMVRTAQKNISINKNHPNHGLRVFRQIPEFGLDFRDFGDFRDLIAERSNEFEFLGMQIFTIKSLIDDVKNNDFLISPMHYGFGKEGVDLVEFDLFGGQIESVNAHFQNIKA